MLARTTTGRPAVTLASAVGHTHTHIQNHSHTRSHIRPIASSTPAALQHQTYAKPPLLSPQCFASRKIMHRLSLFNRNLTSTAFKIHHHRAYFKQSHHQHLHTSPSPSQKSTPFPNNTIASASLHENKAVITDSDSNSPQPPQKNTNNNDSGSKKGKSISKELYRIASLAKPERALLLGAVSLLFVSSSVTMMVPFSMGKIMDIVLINMGVKVAESSLVAGLSKLSLPVIFGGLSGIFILGALANFGRVVLMKISGERIVQRLRVNIFQHLLQQDISFFDKNKTGELISRLAADTVVVGKSITNNISDGLRSLVTACIGIGMMTYVNPSLTLIMMTIVPPVALTAVYYGRVVRKLSKSTQTAISTSTASAEETLSQIRTVRSFAQEPTSLQSYTHHTTSIYTIALKEAYASATFFGFAGLSGNLVLLILLYYGGTMVSEGLISAGDLTSYFLYTAYVGMSFIGISGFYTELMKGIGASQRLWELMESRGSVEVAVGKKRIEGPVLGRIDVKGVGFAYPTRTDAPIFNALSFSVLPGTHVAVVGRSGSGKSSIAQLLLRFYDPQVGSISIDGYDLKDLDPQHIRQDLIAYVSQEPVLFSATIHDNIAYGLSPQQRESVTDVREAVIRAAALANAKEFIDAFPDGYETLLGEKGVGVSGGQKQRIAIARALIKNPKILILDEATSALDAASEHLVQDSISKIVKGRTVITIAHRLSTIQQADIVLMIDEGRVIEMGTYDELVSKKDGHFRTLVEAQLNK